MSRERLAIDPTWDQLTVEEAVHYYDVDGARMVWHGHYLRFMECARERYFADRGLTYDTIERLGMLAPVVRCRLEFLRPARFGDQLSVTVANVPSDKSLVQLRFAIRLRDGVLVCAGESTQVFCDAQGELLRSRPAVLDPFFAAIAPRREDDRATGP